MAVLMLCALCVPASAASEITVNQTGTFVSGDRTISIAGEYETESLVITTGSKLTIGAGVTLKVTDDLTNSGEIELLGTLDLSQCTLNMFNASINIGLTGELIYDPEVITLNNITGPGRITPIGNIPAEGNTNSISDDTDAGQLTVKEDKAISGSHTYDSIEVSGSEGYPNNIITPCTLTVESGAAITNDNDFSLKNGCSATIKSGASVTCGYNFNVNDGSSVTIESGASVTCGYNFNVYDGSSVTIESGASVTCSRFVVKSGSSVTVKSGASVTCDDLDISGFGSGCVMVLENGASITVNSYVDIGDSAFLGISGILTGTCTGFTGNVTLLPGGTVDLEAANGNVANKLVAKLQQYDEGAKAEQNSDGTYRVTAHRHVYAEEGTCCGAEHMKNTVSGDTASTLSEGNMTVVCTIAAAVVFGLGGFILGKKKKTSNS